MLIVLNVTYGKQNNSVMTLKNMDLTLSSISLALTGYLYIMVFAFNESVRLFSVIILAVNSLAWLIRLTDKRDSETKIISFGKWLFRGYIACFAFYFLWLASIYSFPAQNISEPPHRLLYLFLGVLSCLHSFWTLLQVIKPKTTDESDSSNTENHTFDGSIKVNEE